MPRPTRYTCYPEPRALGVVNVYGSIAASLNAAVSAWADVLARATANNADTFERAEWSALAESLNGCWRAPGIATGPALAQSVTDGFRLTACGAQWLDNDKRRMNALVRKLAALDAAHAWAVVYSVAAFWQRSQTVDREKDEWWTLAWRSEHVDR